MSRYGAMFERCASRGEGAFGTFVMLGDPAVGAAYFDALVEGGADMVELGIPFSDPVADGPVIQAAAERALRAGMRTTDCLALVADFRKRHPALPIGILTYANIVAARGIARFATELAEARLDSLLVVDVPSIEAEPYAEAARAAGIDPIMIAAPNTPPAVIERIARLSSGYTYCVARPGVTGADTHLSFDYGRLFASLEKAGAPPPVVGFGMSTPDHAREALASGAAGVICGSAIVGQIADGRSAADIADFVRMMKAATRPELPVL